MIQTERIIVSFFSKSGCFMYYVNNFVCLLILSRASWKQNAVWMGKLKTSKLSLEF